MAEHKQLKITLVRSLIGRMASHRLIVKSLGLRRMHHSVVVKNNPSVMGMVNKISYLLKVEECK